MFLNYQLDLEHYKVRHIWKKEMPENMSLLANALYWHWVTAMATNGPFY